MSFKDKIAIITGAASEMGLGFATARMLARQGATVWLSDLDEKAVIQRADELKKEGLNAHALAQDVTDEAQWEALAGRVTETCGRIDILVNNAGIAVLGPTDALALSSWQKQIDVNLSSVYLGCRAVLPAMRAQKSGAIVNLSSVAGLVGIPGAAAYAASKGGVRMFSKALALEYAGAGIRVNSVHPGVIWTQMQQVAIKDNPEQYDAINASIPMGRMGQPDDIASMIKFLASDEAQYITGAEFVVDGGFTAQ